MTTKCSVSFFLMVVFYNLTLAQSVGINTNNPDTSAALDVVSTNKGVLVPRLTSLQKTNITNPATGLMVYDTDLAAFCFYNGSSWVTIEKGDVNYVGSSYLGKTSGTGSTGTSEGSAANRNNIYIGNGVGNANTIGVENVGIGEYALSTVNTGSGNIGIGKYAGSNIGSGSNNTIIGNNASVIANSISNATAIGANANAAANNVVILGGAGAYAVNVGIGTPSPTHILDIHGSTSLTHNIQSSGSTAYTRISVPTGNESAMNFSTYVGGNLSTRWLVGKDSVSETGSNVGSDFFVNRYDDNGTYSGQPFAISRTDGSVTIGKDQVSIIATTLNLGGSVAVPTIAISASLTTTTLNGDDYCVIFSGTSVGNTVILPAASTCVGRIYSIINHSSSGVTVAPAYYITVNTTNSILSAGNNILLISDGTSWHKAN